uniref:tryptase-2-like n=1 Tax=Styela clava TaxID=7725 RepID=UPI001939B1A1|nr:tryptase-2-like [Styela clava]
MMLLTLAAVVVFLTGNTYAARTWSACSKDCGYGVQTLEFCAGFYGKCTTYSRACKIKDCEPGECDKPCGGGRVCNQNCHGPGGTPPCDEVCEVCNDFPCVPGFDTYSECTKPCGGGTRFKVPMCADGTPETCPKEYEECNAQACPPVSCPIGQQHRYDSMSSCCRTISSSSTCGKNNEPNFFQKIFGGELSTLGLWPWLAVIVDKRSASAACGGSLIHKKWILSAAHCMRARVPFDPADFYALLGTIKISTPSAGHVREEIVRYIPHEDYDPTTSENDIGLIELENEVTYSGTVMPICMPEYETPPEDWHCYAAGFGITNFEDLSTNTPSDDMFHVGLKVFPIDVCKNELRLLVDEIGPVQRDRSLCVGRLSGSRDTCRGDSGGPIMCQRCHTCAWFIAGLTSFGQSCGQNKPGVYSRIEFYEDWIKMNSGITFTGFSLSC